MHYHARYVSAGNEDGGAKKDILFISRAVGRRTISNELELLIALQRVPRLKRVVLEELSLSDQMLLLASSTTLLAVHGQALAWTPFLPSAVRPTAVVEIILSNVDRRFNSCYHAWCNAFGVRYSRVAGELTGGCTGGTNRWDNSAVRHIKLLNCNVTVNVGNTLGAVLAAAKHTSAHGDITRPWRVSHFSSS